MSKNISEKSDSQKMSLPVVGMHCASCAGNVERLLNKQVGVVQASVNLANAMAHIEYMPAQTNAQLLQKAVQSIGFDLIIDTEEAAFEKIEDYNRKTLKSLTNKSIASIVLSVPLIALGMLFMNLPYANYIMWALATPIVFVFGKGFFVGAYQQARNKSMNMDTLVALSTGVAYLFSVFNTLFPQYWVERGLHPHVYFEASAVIITFILLGRLLEAKAKANVSSSIKKLMNLQPRTVMLVKESGEQQEVSVKDVNVGNLILVKSGERIAVDGILVSGSSYVDESMITGESMPIEKNINDSVLAGTINQKGSFVVKVEKLGGNTLLAQIIHKVQEAQAGKVPMQRLADKIVRIFVPIVISIALLAFVCWLLFGGNNSFTYALLAFVTVLVIACPCALGLATPTAIMVGIGKGAEHGILIKNAESLELASKINALVLDKTGTITEGKPQVTDILWLHLNAQYANVLASIESMSEHPLAEAIVKHLNIKELPPLQYFESLTGLGVKAVYENRTYVAGNLSLLQKQHISIDKELEAAATTWQQQAKTIIGFANGERVLAIIAIADTIKPTSVLAIEHIKSLGIEVYMLTGDNASVAQAIAKQTGIDHYQAECLPQHKVDFIKELQGKGKVVAMVGDGINDSSALAQADISIAMGQGSDIAIDIAQMTIISNNLTKISQAIQISSQTITAIRQNLFWAFIYNLIGIPIAAGILYPINGFLLNPMIAGLAMALSSVSVVTNSLRIRTKKLS